MCGHREEEAEEDHTEIKRKRAHVKELLQCVRGLSSLFNPFSVF